MTTQRAERSAIDVFVADVLEGRLAGPLDYLLAVARDACWRTPNPEGQSDAARLLLAAARWAPAKEPLEEDCFFKGKPGVTGEPA